MEDTVKTQPAASTKQGSSRLTETEAGTMAPKVSATGPQHTCCGCLAWASCWAPNNGNGVSLTSLPALGALFLQMGCLIQP